MHTKVFISILQVPCVQRRTWGSQFYFLSLLLLKGPLLCLSQTTLSSLADTIVLKESIAEELPLAHVVLNLDKALTQYDLRHRGNLTGSLRKLQPTSRQFNLIPTVNSDLFRINLKSELIVIKRIDRETICQQRAFDAWSNLGAQSGGTSAGASSRSSAQTCVLELRLRAIEFSSDAEINEEVRQRRKLRLIFAQLTVEDINDNRPQCHSPASAIDGTQSTTPVIEIYENARVGDILVSWLITDADTSQHGIYGVRKIGERASFGEGDNDGQDHFVLDIVDHTHSEAPWSSVTVQLHLHRQFKLSPPKKPTSNLLGEYVVKYAAWDSPGAADIAQANMHAFSRTVCELRVHILDVNDHSPVWVSPKEFTLGQSLTLDIREDSNGRSSELLRLHAKDEDIGPNAKIRYLLMASSGEVPTVKRQGDDNFVPNNFLHLDPHTGILRLRHMPQDYETLSKQLHLRKANADESEASGIQLFIKAVDSPKDESQQRSSPVVSLIIWIHDVNDNAPKITVLGISSPMPANGLQAISPMFVGGGNGPQENTLFVSENLPPLELIATVTVEDPDTGAGGRVECEIVEYARRSGLSLPVRENASFHLMKNAYSLLDGGSAWSAKQNFGYQILTAVSLDREKQSSYELRLVCVDGVKSLEEKLNLLDLTAYGSGIRGSEDRLTSIVSIYVKVLDINDNVPVASPNGNVFLDAEHSVIECEVTENALPNTQICQLKAYDADEGPNAAVEWQLSADAPPWVGIDSASGWLMISPPRGSQRPNSAGMLEKPDRETADRHNFTVVLRDGVNQAGRPSAVRLSSSVAVSLRILDVNDHAPEIAPFHYFSISESALAGGVVCTLNATDLDEPGTENSALTYVIAAVRSLDPQNLSFKDRKAENAAWQTHKSGLTLFSPPFEINSTTGTITVGARGLDREEREIFELLIEVVDGKPALTAGSLVSPPVTNMRQNSIRLTTQTTVQINVLDENDNAPTFIYPKNGLGTVTLTCTDILTLPKVVIQVVANDSDKGLNAEIEYSISFNKDIPDAGSSSTQQLAVDDSKLPAPTSSSPVLGSRPLMRQEGTVTHKQVASSSRSREYDLPWFDIEPRSGEVSLVAADGLSLRCQALRQDQLLVNRELGKYSLIITAKDKGVPSLSAAAQIYVRIITTDTDVATRTRQPDAISNKARFVGIPPTESVSHILPSETQNTVYGDSYTVNERFTLFSSPVAFWAATVCLAVATTVLFGLICTFVTIAFRKRRMTPAVDGDSEEGHNVDMYSRVVPSNCLSLNSTLPVTCESKALRVAYQDTSQGGKQVRMCYPAPDSGFYDWPQTKYDAGKQTAVVSSTTVPASQSPNTPLLSLSQQETYHYGRLHLPEGQLPAQIVLNGLEVYQPLLPGKNAASPLYHPGLTVRTDVPMQHLISGVSPSPASLLLHEATTPTGNGAKFKLQNKLEPGRNTFDRPSNVDRTRHSKDDIELDLQLRTCSDGVTANGAELARALQARCLSRSTTTLQQQVKLETSFV
nr:unnamed protein product [Spirometra erinaceieuropaei]